MSTMHSPVVQQSSARGDDHRRTRTPDKVTLPSHSISTSMPQLIQPTTRRASPGTTSSRASSPVKSGEDETKESESSCVKTSHSTSMPQLVQPTSRRVSPTTTSSRASSSVVSGEDETQESESSSVKTQQTGTSSRLLVNEGIEYHKEGKYANAIKSFQQALKSQLLNTEGDHPMIANTLANIGSVYLKQGRHYLAAASLGEAFAMMNRLRKTCKTKAEKAMIPMAGVLNNLGTVYFLRGDNKRSLEYYRGALNDARNFGGSSKKEVANALHNIGRLSSLEKDWGTALDMLNASLRLEQEIYGKDDITLVDTLDLIGFAHYSSDSLDEAMVTFAESLSIVHANCGLVHEKVATALMHVGMVMERQGRLEDSLQTYSTAQDVFQRVGLGSGHRGVRAATCSVNKLTRLIQLKIHDESGQTTMTSVESKANQGNAGLDSKQPRTQRISEEDAVKKSCVVPSNAASFDLVQRDDDNEEGDDVEGDDDDHETPLESKESTDHIEYTEYREDPGWEQDFSILDSRDSDSIPSEGNLECRESLYS